MPQLCQPEHVTTPRSHFAPNAEGALILGGDYRGLGVVRSLGRRGIPVAVVATDHIIATMSRYCGQHWHWNSDNPGTQVEHLLRLADKGFEGWTLFPTTDENTTLVAQNHSELSRRFRVIEQDWQRLQWALDKRFTYAEATAAGVHVPRTHYPGSYEDLKNFDCRFPVIVKPARKEGFNLFVHNKGWIAHDRASLMRRYESAARLVDPTAIMIQEMIPGAGNCQWSFAALCDDGKPLASLAACRRRQFPLDLGRSSTYVESAENTAVERSAMSLLAATKYRGLVEVEFKYDARDGNYYLLDVNPRVWGWHTLAIRAGVDFPYLAWKYARGEPVDHARGAPGIHWVRFSTDSFAVVLGFLTGELTFSEYLRSMRGPSERAIMSFDDPLPALFEVPLLARLAIRRRAL